MVSIGDVVRLQSGEQSFQIPYLTEYISAPLAGPIQKDAQWWAMRPAQSAKPATYTCPLCGRRLHAMSAHTLIAPEGDAERRRHAHTECVVAARKAGTVPTYDDWRATQPRRPGLLARLLSLFVVALLAGCGSSSAQHAPASPRPAFAYDRSQPLGYVDHGRIGAAELPVTIDDVSFRSGRLVIEGYLVQPRSGGRRAAVVLVHGSGGDRSELLEKAKLLAARGVVALTITEPSTSNPPARAATTAETLKRVEAVQVRDVVAIRRAVDLLQSLPRVDPKRNRLPRLERRRESGHVRRRVRAAREGACAPLRLEPRRSRRTSRSRRIRSARVVQNVLTRIDPIHYVARVRPGSLLLEDGRKGDAVVPSAGLMNIVRAAPRGTTVRWYDAPHELNDKAYRDAFDWLERKLRQGTK